MPGLVYRIMALLYNLSVVIVGFVYFRKLSKTGGARAGQLHLNSLSRYCETYLSRMMRPMRPRIPRLARIDTRPRFYVGRKGDA